jgi:hypothetical protein
MSKTAAIDIHQAHDLQVLPVYVDDADNARRKTGIELRAIGPTSLLRLPSGFFNRLRLLFSSSAMVYANYSIYIPLETARELSDKFIDSIYYDEGEYSGESYSYAEEG